MNPSFLCSCCCCRCCRCCRCCGCGCCRCCCGCCCRCCGCCCTYLHLISAFPRPNSTFDCILHRLSLAFDYLFHLSVSRSPRRPVPGRTRRRSRSSSKSTAFCLVFPLCPWPKHCLLPCVSTVSMAKAVLFLTVLIRFKAVPFALCLFHCIHGQGSALALWSEAMPLPCSLRQCRYPHQVGWRAFIDRSVGRSSPMPPGRHQPKWHAI